jgi:hypothetical protein
MNSLQHMQTAFGCLDYMWCPGVAKDMCCVPKPVALLCSTTPSPPVYAALVFVNGVVCIV